MVLPSPSSRLVVDVHTRIPRIYITKKETQVVVYQQKKQTPKQNKNKISPKVANVQKMLSQLSMVHKKRTQIISTRGMSGNNVVPLSPDAQLRLALANPFDKRAEGVKICDNYAFPTAPYHLKGTVSLVSPASNTAGSVMVYANPLYSYVDLSNSSFQGATFTSTTSMAQYVVNTAIFGASSYNNIGGFLDNYRVVSCGFKIRVQAPELNRTGRLMFAPITIGRSIPGVNALGTQALTANSGSAYRLLGGLTPPEAASSIILQLPGSFEISLNDLATKDLLLLPKPSAPAWQIFHSTDGLATYNATYFQSDNQLTNAAGASIVDDIADVLDCTGWSGFIIHFEGLPATATPVIDIEYIYHIEGTPNVNASSASSPVPSGLSMNHIPTSAYNKVIDYASRLPWGKMIDAGLSNLGLLARGAGSRQGNPMIQY